ncbi:phosphoenolpyruvate synthase [Candidatus Wolfebacteria bacterium CG03_land_8_20_14_0_80_40_12]|uniref:Phosphoenolpyruvate synthase n=1 Tax=Candidatus Wolfebacteria bacterium CG03_land_8_20_14_0_80_40_12 TaxID=1975069 RepID=A0A2M7B5C0_9BACT|nr:MAG: phosphoenolpyruvate synthase [Candidatus Wolfebacteria bacterium CG03_land_8_20_14_0_80_40_12]
MINHIHLGKIERRNRRCSTGFIKQLEDIGIKDVPEVGGKNASLGEMIQNLAPKGMKIPGGFVVTASAYRYFLEKSEIRNSLLRSKSPEGQSKTNSKFHFCEANPRRVISNPKLNLEEFIKQTLKDLNTKNLKDLSRRGRLIREAVKSAELPKNLGKEIILAYREMEKEYGKNVDVAVRSSATAEDLPGASFAGGHETFLNIRGEKELLQSVRAAMASLFTDRAISYRVDKGFSHFEVALSVGVEKMVRSDAGCSGVIFTLDTESGFPGVVLINGSWGLGELIVQGKVIPDEFLVFKKTNAIIDKKLGVKNRKMVYGKAWLPGIKNIKTASTSKKEKESFILSDKEIVQLARWAVLVEEHYSKKNKCWTPMDLEWAKDGKTGELFIVQARPETVHALRDFSKIKEYILLKPKTQNLKPIVRGASVGSKIAVGKARVILDAKNLGQFKAGEILITDMTDPDWEPIMKIASAIVTDKGGRTSHAAIVSRELGIPAIVGTGNVTRKIKTGQTITVDTTGSEGVVYDSALKFKIIEHDIKKFPRPKTKIMLNIATPETAFEKSFLPNDGVGLAREEFIIASDIGIHPNALINYKKLPSKIKKIIDKKTIGYKNKTQFYVDKLAYGIAKISAAFYPKPVIVRFSDFKTNEYRSLIGGELYEPLEENPMIGWRGASRYYHPNFSPAFVLELKAIKKVREKMGLDNVVVMVPFCRTVEEGRKVLEIIKKFLNLKPSTLNPLKVYVMCEIPSNVVLADEFLKIFDGMSIGSNDLTQLTVGIDRDASELVRGIANENDASVKKLIAEVIKKCRAKKKYIGICGQGPSDYPEFAEFLVEQGIESISLNPDTIVKTTQKIYEKEKKLKK